MEKHGLVTYFIDLEDKSLIDEWTRKLKALPLKTIKLISKFTDLNRRTMLSVAPIEIRDMIHDKILFLGKFQLTDMPLIYQSDTAVVFEALDFKPEKYYEELYGIYKEDSNSDCISLTEFREFMADMVNNKDKKQQKIEFDKFDTNKKNKLSKDEFLHACEVLFGKQYQVALKFMEIQSSFKREQQIRDCFPKKTQDLSRF